MTEIGIEQARKTLGDIANQALYGRQTTYLTRNGRRIAAIVPLEDTVTTTTTEYSTWSIDHTATVTDYVTGALGDFASDYNIDELVHAFRDAINNELPAGVELHGEIVYGPYPKTDIDLAAAVDAVDFWALAAQYDATR